MFAGRGVMCFAAVVMDVEMSRVSEWFSGVSIKDKV